MMLPTIITAQNGVIRLYSEGGGKGASVIVCLQLYKNEK